MTNDNKYHCTIEIVETDRLGPVEIKFEHVMTIDSLSMNFNYVSMDFSIDDT